MDNSGGTTKAPIWNWIDADGNKVDTFDYTTHPVFANAEGVTVTDASDSTKSADFVKIPKFYVKTMASGPINTFAQGKQCWWISIDETDGFHVHPAFLRKDDGTATDYVRICCDDSYIENFSDSTTVSRMFDVYDFGMMTLLYILHNKSIDYIYSNDLIFNENSGLKFISNSSYRTLIAGWYAHVTGNAHMSIATESLNFYLDTPVPSIDRTILVDMINNSSSVMQHNGSGGINITETYASSKIPAPIKIDFNIPMTRGNLYGIRFFKSGDCSAGVWNINLMDLFLPDNTAVASNASGALILEILTSIDGRFLGESCNAYLSCSCIINTLYHTAEEHTLNICITPILKDNSSVPNVTGVEGVYLYVDVQSTHGYSVLLLSNDSLISNIKLEYSIEGIQFLVKYVIVKVNNDTLEVHIIENGKLSEVYRLTKTTTENVDDGREPYVITTYADSEKRIVKLFMVDFNFDGSNVMAVQLSENDSDRLMSVNLLLSTEYTQECCASASTSTSISVDDHSNKAIVKIRSALY